jgi:hypothetical protein
MSELQVSLMADEDLTVIAAHAFHEKEQDEDEIKADVRDNESSGHPLGQEVRSISYEDSTPLKPRPMERPQTPPGDTSRGFFCSGVDVFDNVIPLSTSSPVIAQLTQAQSSNSLESPPTRLYPSPSHHSPSVLKAGALAWREMNGRAASANLGIDFRTGMSGHSALTSSSPHDYLDPRKARMSMGMSSHTGLTMWKANRQQPTRSANLSMPVLPAGSMQQDDRSTVDSSSTAHTK